MGRYTPELALVDPSLAEVLRELHPDPADCLAPRPLERIAALPYVPHSATAEAVPPGLSVPLRDVAPPPLARRETVDRQARTTQIPSDRRFRPGRTLAWVGVGAILATPLLAFIDATAKPTLSPLVALPERSGPTPEQQPVATPVQPEAATPKPRAGGASAGSPGSAGQKRQVAPRSNARARTARDRTKTAATKTARTAKPEITTQAKKPSAPDEPRGEGQGTASTEAVRWDAVPSATLYSLILMRAGERVDFRPVTNKVELRPKDADAKAVVYHWFVYAGFGPKENPRFGPLHADGTVRLAAGGVVMTEVE